MLLRVEQMRREADAIVSIDLCEPGGAELDAWEPGAHVDVALRSGLIRQYSLCGAIDDRARYRIAVLHKYDGRGGSREIHEALRVGDMIEVGPPRNHFALVPAERYVFIAGGIGITPIVPMIEHATLANIDWALFYLGRTFASMAFVRQVSSYGERVRVLPDDSPHGVTLDQIISGAAGAEIYCCGPTGLIEAVESRCAASGLSTRCHVERFSPAVEQVAQPLEPFVAVLSSTGEEVRVPADKTLLHCLLEHGADVLFSCEEGTCGTCAVEVVSGTPLHRDSVLSHAEKATGNRMMVCVSRSLTPRLVLKL